MSTVRRIAKNTTVLFIAQAASCLLVLIYMMYAARYLGPANYGIIIFAIAFTGIFAVLSDFGLQQLTVREISRNRKLTAKYIANVSVIRIIFALITYGLIALAINIMGYPVETRQLVYLIGFSAIINSLNLIFFSLFQAYEKMELQALGQLLNVLLTFAGIFIAIKLNLSLLYFGYAFVLASLLFSIYCILVTRIQFFPGKGVISAQKAGVDWHLCKEMIKETVPFGLIVILGTIYYAADSVIVSYTQGDAAVGYYGAAYKVMQALLFIPLAWGVSIFPVMVKLHINSQKSLTFAVERSFKYFTMLAIPTGVGLTLLAERVMLTTFGAEYMPSVIALQILAWAMVFLYMSTSFVVFLLSSNRQVTCTKILAFCTILNVVLNIAFIPKFSYVGASIILLLTSLVYFVLLYFTYQRVESSFSNKKLWSMISKLVFASALMGIFVHFCQGLNLIILIPSAVCIYSLLVFVARVLDKEDISLLRRSFK